MEAWIAQNIVPALEKLFDTIGWFGVVVIMALESANIPIPSEVTMPLAGWLLVPDTATWVQAALITGFFGALGCTIGSMISYGLGYWGGRPLVERYGKYILVDAEDIDRFDHWFQRWGDYVSFFSRLLPVVRTFISFPAGVFKINFAKFTVLTFIGSFIWCAALGLVGFFWGDHWEQILGIMGPFKYPIVIIGVAGLVWYVWHHITGPSRRAARRLKAAESTEE